MRKSKFSPLILAAISFSATARAGDFSECHVVGDTVLSLYPILPPSDSSVPDGALAITSAGADYGKKEILADAPMHFRLADGSVSEGYQWLYAPVNPVDDSGNLYWSAPPGGERITIAMDPSGMETKVTYTGNRHGLYLTLSCQ